MSRGKHARNTAPAIAFRLEEGARKAADVQQAIIDLRAIHGLGANAISVQDVAKRAHVSRAFIYAHPDLRAKISGKYSSPESLPASTSADPPSASTSSSPTNAPLNASQSYEDTISAQATLISSLTRQNQKLQKTLTNLEKDLTKAQAEYAALVDEYKKWSIERDALYARLAGLTDRE